MKPLELARGITPDFPSSAARTTHSDDAFGRAMANLNDAAVAFPRGDLERARALLAAAERTFAGSDMEHSAVDDRFELEWLRERLACAAS